VVRRELRVVRWLLWVAVAYVFLLGASVGAINYLARAEGGDSYTFLSDDGFYRIEGYRYLHLPFRLSGAGPSPGEVRVLDRSGRVIDSERLEDVESVQDVRWSRFNVTFGYRRDGRTYQTSLDLPQ
jgi:hypothetical protein